MYHLSPTPEGWNAELALVQSSRCCDLNQLRDHRFRTLPHDYQCTKFMWQITIIKFFGFLNVLWLITAHIATITLTCAVSSLLIRPNFIYEVPGWRFFHQISHMLSLWKKGHSLGNYHRITASLNQSPVQWCSLRVKTTRNCRKITTSSSVNYYYYYRVLRAICCQPVDGSLVCFM